LKKISHHRVKEDTEIFRSFSLPGGTGKKKIISLPVAGSTFLVL